MLTLLEQNGVINMGNNRHKVSMIVVFLFDLQEDVDTFVRAWNLQCVKKINENGCEIDEHVLDHIFKLFEREHGYVINVNSQYWQQIMKLFMSILFQCSFLLILQCHFLVRLIPSPNIPREFVMDDGANDELISEMDGTTQDAINDMETNLDQACLSS
jgi:hypothetical protein